MALTEYLAGSQTCVITTEHTLNTTTPETTAGVYQLVLDLNALAAGDTLEIRLKEKAGAATTQRLLLLDTLTGVQAEPLWMSPSLHLRHGWDMTVKQTAGVGRAIPWSIRRAS
jgi:hypothetical protein